MKRMLGGEYTRAPGMGSRKLDRGFYSLTPPNPITPPSPILPLQLEFGVSVNADGSVDTASVVVSGNSFDGPP